jgi:hypothetical protein
MPHCKPSSNDNIKKQQNKQTEIFKIAVNTNRGKKKGYLKKNPHPHNKHTFLSK